MSQDTEITHVCLTTTFYKKPREETFISGYRQYGEMSPAFPRNTHQCFGLSIGVAPVG